MALSAFFAQEDIIVDWVTFSLIALFMFSFIIQSFLLQKKCYPLFLFRVLIVIFLIFQVGWRHINFAPSHQIFTQETGDSYDEQDDLLGFRLSPNLHNAQLCRIRQIMGNDTLCKICYSSDSLCRRISDDAFTEEYLVNQSHPGNHAVFLGCSFTFGDGLMYSSTFPYLFEELNPDYKSYNYGVPGFGPHQIALLFDDRVNTINEEAIPEKKGFALYTYIDDHLNRVYGGSIYLRWAPFLSRNHDVYIENDSLTIKKRSQAQLKFANFLNQTTLFRIFDVQFSYPKKETFYKRFASIINYTAKKYWELKPDNHFYVSIYPGYGIDLNWVQ
ncbi:MAG: hypothetical protein LBI82_12035, partial [Dysgonamonadaceae bacterium]|nr:hypothetical protein [Dysgonamonadaceae bacterium]